MAKEINGFIQQTANDYDMEYDDVMHIYTIHRKLDHENKTDVFYDKLEEFIKDRASNY